MEKKKKPNSPLISLILSINVASLFTRIGNVHTSRSSFVFQLQIFLGI